MKRDPMTGLLSSPTINSRYGPRKQPDQGDESCQWFTVKLVGMMTLIAFDLALNSSLEYDAYANQADMTLILFE